jgi:hypothetical protein
MSGTSRAGSSARAVGRAIVGVKGGGEERAARAPDAFGEPLPGAERAGDARKDRQADRGVRFRAQLVDERGDGLDVGLGVREHALRDLTVVPRPRRPRAQAPPITTSST